MRKIKYKQNRSGFTLIEVLIVTAMISILAAAILVSVSSQRERARRSKVLAEVSGTIQPMMMCWSDGGTVNGPTWQGTGAICSLSDSYGAWPKISKEGYYYWFGRGSTPGSDASDNKLSDSNDWFIDVRTNSNGNGEVLICCNSASMKCAEASSCNANTQL